MAGEVETATKKVMKDQRVGEIGHAATASIGYQGGERYGKVGKY